MSTKHCTSILAPSLLMRFWSFTDNWGSGLLTSWSSTTVSHHLHLLLFSVPCFLPAWSWMCKCDSADHALQKSGLQAVHPQSVGRGLSASLRRLFSSLPVWLSPAVTRSSHTKMFGAVAQKRVEFPEKERKKRTCFSVQRWKSIHAVSQLPFNPPAWFMKAIALNNSYVFGSAER